MQEQVYEYFNNYFDGQLNESTSDEDIMEAVYDLIDLTDVVLDVVGLDELKQPTGVRGDRIRDFAAAVGRAQKRSLAGRKFDMSDPIQRNAVKDIRKSKREHLRNYLKGEGPIR